MMAKKPQLLGKAVHAVAIFAAGLGLCVQAETLLSEDVGNLTWTYVVEDGKAKVWGGSMKPAIGWTVGAVEVPGTLGGLPVTAIGSYAFFEMTGITSLKVPEGVETIEFYACRGCTNLQSVTLPATLRVMGNAVFHNCAKLEAGEIPDAVTSMGRDTFWRCKSMRTVKFSPQVTELGAMTCYDCDSLTEVTIPDIVTNIGVSAFLDCDNLRSVTLPTCEVAFGNFAFNNCASLERVDLPSGFTDLDSVFHNCGALSTVRIRRDVESVDPATFAGCLTLTNIEVEAGNPAYRSVRGALYDVTGRVLVAWPAALRPVEIPAEVESIGDSAFGWTSDPTEIVIPDGVAVSEHAFAEPPEEEPPVPDNPVTPVEPEIDEPSGAKIYRNCFKIVPGGIPHLSCMVGGLEGIDYAVDRHASNDWEVVIHGWGMNDSRIKRAMPGEHLVDDNNMPSGVNEVTGTAQPFVFEFCNWYRNGALGSKTWYGYISIALDENAELVILESAICNQQNVLSVTGTEDLPATLDFKTVDRGDWLELSRQCIPADTVGWVVIPSKIVGKPVRAIGRYAFINCSKITKVTLPDTIESIGGSAFVNCTSLQELQLPDSVVDIGAEIASRCDSLGNLFVGGGVASVCSGAFASTGMTNLVLSVGITNIMGYAFASNRKLKSVTIPQSVERIQRCAFDDCGELKSVSVPWATVVEDGAFPSGCAITRYGPDISVPDDLARPDEETKIAMMRTLDWRDYASLSEVCFLEDRLPYSEIPDSRSAIYACAHLGISPAVVDNARKGSSATAYYRMPSVKIQGIDPARRTITGRVISAEGTAIVSPPLKRVFGFHRIYEDEGRMLEGTDWGEWRYNTVPGISVDLTDYVSSNGIFRISYGEEVEMEKYPQPVHLFRIRLFDRDGRLW